MVVTAQIVKKRRERVKKNGRKKERRKRKHSNLLNRRDAREHTHTNAVGIALYARTNGRLPSRHGNAYTIERIRRRNTARPVRYAHRTKSIRRCLKRKMFPFSPSLSLSLSSLFLLDVVVATSYPSANGLLSLLL
jgi:hypothetical protein